MNYLFQSSFIALLSVALWSCSSPEPQAVFTATPDGQTMPLTVAFTNQSVNATSYQWDFGDGQTSTEESPSHTYTLFGTFTAKLTAVNGEQTSEQTYEVVVPEPPRRQVEIATDFGVMKVELSNYTPKHRDNFIKLAEEGFFDDLLFHRVIQGFMVQGGDPDSKDAEPGEMLGNGGPGYTIPAEIHPGLIHQRGALAAARMGDAVNPEKASSGSQFYLVQGQPVSPQILDQLEQYKGVKYSAQQREVYANTPGTPMLDGEYTVFGQVIEGIEVIDAIAGQQRGELDRPVEDVKMQIRVIQ